MRLFIALIILFFSTPSHADLGGCVVYKVKYVLKNGDFKTGYLPLYGYENHAYLDDQTKTNKYCDDLEFQKLINQLFYKQQKKLVFNIYTELHLIDFGKSAYQADNPNSIACVFTDSSSMIHLNLDSIKYTIFLSTKSATWDYPEVQIQIMDTKTSLMMQQNKVINHTWLFHTPVLEKLQSKYTHEFDSYFVVNYNKNISLEDLKKELNEVSEKIYGPELNLINSKSKNKTQIFEQEKRNIVIPLIYQLRQKGIILIKVQSTC
jgi:hypothetical protein